MARVDFKREHRRPRGGAGTAPTPAAESLQAFRAFADAMTQLARRRARGLQVQP